MLDVAPRERHKQSEVAERTGLAQGTISKWQTGESVPDKAAHVASFARAFGRDVLEAFVAAGHLREAEAGRGLTPESRAYLAELREIHDGLPEGVEPAVYRAIRDGLAAGRAGRPAVEKVTKPVREA